MSAKKPKSTPKVQKNQYMQVFVRCRPLIDNESSQRSLSPIDIQGQRDIAIQDRCNSKITKTYSFDRIFEPSSTQTYVYQTVVEPLIKDVLSGFNCTVFAYGQTGSGKTFTMEGDIGSEKMFAADSKAGLIPRAVCALFDELRVLQSEYTVRISLLELYNEEVYDLLSPDEVPPKLRLYDDVTKKGSVIVQGLQEVMVHTQSQVLDELRKGSAKRQVAATLMNAQSSRSHTIFSVTVHSKENAVDGEELLKTGKLNLVDLAGSENIGRSGSLDKRAREAASINQSLLTLSRVTACLVEHQPHIPYRESKLTRLLQDSLGGRTKASLIATISPALSNVEETLSTLDYAHRAKSVANRPEVNQKVSQVVVMKEYMDVIQDLKKKLDLTRNGTGVYVNDENYKQIIAQTQERNKEITDFISMIRAVGLQKKTIEDTFLAFTKTHEVELKNLENVDNNIAKTTEEIGFASETLAEVKDDQDEAGNLLENLVVKENELRSQAEQLTNVVEVTQGDSSKIHDKLDFSRVILVENEITLKQLRDKGNFHEENVRKYLCAIDQYSSQFDVLMISLESLKQDLKEKNTSIQESIEKVLNYAETSFKKVNNLLFQMCEKQKALNKNSHEGVLKVHLDMVETVESAEKLLKDVCANYGHMISNLSVEVKSLMEFVDDRVRDIKELSRTHVSEITEQLDNIHAETDASLQNTCILSNGLRVVQKKPLCKMTDDIKMMLETAADIRSLCQKRDEDIVTHNEELSICKEDVVASADSVVENLKATVYLVHQQQADVSSSCRNMEDVFRANLEPFVHKFEASVSSIQGTVSNNLNIVDEAEGGIKKVLSYNHLSSVEKEMARIEESRSECLPVLNNAVVCSKDMVLETEQLNQYLSSEYEKLQHSGQNFEAKGNEVVDQFLEDIQSTSCDVLMHLESGKSAVNQIVSDEIKHDMPTGRTPNRKSYGPIPEPSSLPSPVIRKIKPRIQRASWKKLMRSPRKPLLSTMSLQDIDDGMSSDSEVTILKKKPFPTIGLQKASSLCDLRSNAVFQRPRIPKKFSKKAS